MTKIVYPEPYLTALEEGLRRRICSVCVDRNVDGTCGLNDQKECALGMHFPRIVQAVSRVHSTRIDDYVQAIREDVCASCANQDSDGACKVREEVRCVLDRYLFLVVDAIEEAQIVARRQGGTPEAP